MTSVIDRRPLLVGAASYLPHFRLKGGTVIVRVRDQLREAMEANGYLANAPFKTVSVMLRYIAKENLEPDHYRIDERTECLDLAVELDGHALLRLTEEELEKKFKSVLIEVLCDVAANFDLPYEFLDEMR